MAVGLMMAAGAQAAPVLPQQALKAAESFAASHGRTLQPIARKAPGVAAGEASPYYIFNAKDGRGFVVIAGDDRAESVLGYTDSGEFDYATAPENLKSWLAFYADEMARLDKAEAASRPAKGAPDVMRRASFAPIEPMVTTRWNQSGPYWNMCPDVNGSRCVTGCLNTAAAQVMNYKRVPQGATTSIPGYSGDGYTLGTLEPTTFDWSLMHDTYQADDTSASAMECAKLMRYLGQANQSSYSPTGTGANMGSMISSWLNYFGVDPGAQLLNREDYCIADWEAAVYNEIANDRPVLYAGQATGGGHAFVCDGYDGNGFYHINWGWGGLCDGYFKLSVLNPEDNSGWGAASSSDGYAMGQQIIIGVQQPTGVTPNKELRLAFTDIHMDGTNMIFNAWNTLSGGTYTFNGALAFLNDDGSVEVIGGSEWKTAELPMYYGYTDITFDIGDIAQYLEPSASYKLIPVSRQDGTETWYRGNPNNYVELKIDENQQAEYITHPVVAVKGCSFEFPSEHQAGQVQQVKVTVENGADEIYNMVYLFASRRKSMGNATNRTQLVVPKDGKETVTLYFTPDRDAVYRVQVSLDEDGNNVIGEAKVLIGDPLPAPENSVAKFGTAGSEEFPLAEDEYTDSDLLSYGLTASDITSHNIYTGFKATLYDADEFAGESLVVKGSGTLPDEWKGRVASLRVDAEGAQGHGGEFKISHSPSTYCLMPADSKTDEDTQLVMVADAGLDDYQTWVLTDTGNGIYNIALKADPTKRLAVVKTSSSASDDLKLRTADNSSKDQQFVITDCGDGNLQLVARTTGDAVDASDELGAQASVRFNGGNESQKFTLAVPHAITSAALVEADGCSIAQQGSVLTVRGNGTLTVCNPAGQTLISCAVEGERSVNLKQLPAGIYIARLGAATAKLLVK